MKNFTSYLFLMGFVVLAGCESEPSENLKAALISDAVDATSIAQTLAINATSQAVGTATTFSNYDPSIGNVPTAIDILLSGSEDGTLNIPVTDPTDFSNPRVVLNILDGFSTVTPITTGFTAALDPSTIGPSQANPTTPQAVRMFEVGLSQLGGAVVAIKSELTFGVDFVATLSSIDPTNSTLAVVPLKPLKPKTSYYIVITNSLKDTNGDSVGASPAYSAFKGSTALSDPTSEQLRQLISASEFTADFALEDLAAVNIIMSWSFTTQSVGDVLTVVRSLTLASPPTTSLSSSSVILGPAGAGRSVAGLANMFEGTIDVPYYLTVPSGPSINDDQANLNKYWQAANTVAGETNLTRFNPLPRPTATVTIPLLVSTPVDTSSFPPPWKTVIFQHGITQDRFDMLAVADTLASVGLAVVAIDMPLHGRAPGTLFYQAGRERTFDVDFVTQNDPDDEERITDPDNADGNVDTTGAHFANFRNLAVLRDNLRQAVADLFALTAAIPAMDIGDGGDADFDASNIFYVGHSFGSIVGTTFLALEPNVNDAVLGMSGVGLAKMLDGSTVFSPILVNGLALSGISKGSADYESFLGAAQTVVDSADSVNYASAAAASRGILLFEIIGGNTSPSDLFVPNTVPDANDVSTGTGPTIASALSGTEPMIQLMNLSQINSSQTPGADDLKVVVKFTAGDHRSFLTDDAALLDDPDFASVEVTGNIRTGMASFLASGGRGLTIADDTVIQAPPAP